MALVIKKLLQYYHHVFHELNDKRSDDYYLMGSPLPIIGLLGLYYYFVTDFGPKFMEKRQPFKLDKPIIAYNAFQILANLYILLSGLTQLSQLDISCALVDYSQSEFGLFQIRMVYFYFITKLLDLLDTVFFVLRKKFNQVTFLHLYHHMGMTCLSWIAMKYVAGGHSCYLGLLNTAVHAVMYTYYLLAAMGPEYKKYLWWKKYITQIQIIQFLLILIIYGQLLFKPNCQYPKLVVCGLIPQNLFMLILFGQFYYRSYIKPKKAVQNGIPKKDD